MFKEFFFFYDDINIKSKQNEKHNWQEVTKKKNEVYVSMLKEKENENERKRRNKRRSKIFTV